MLKLFEPSGYTALSADEKSEICNGCGSKGLGWLVPNTIYGLNITDCCNIHDYMYSQGATLKDKEFYENLTSNNRRDVIVEMIFNMGLTRFKKFKKTIKAIENKDFASAADEMLNSKWAGQVGQRAITLSNKFRAG